MAQAHRIVKFEEARMLIHFELKRIITCWRLLIASFLVSSVAFSQSISYASDVIEYRNKYFNTVDSSKVVEGSRDGQPHYFIQVVSYEPLTRAALAKRRNNLMTRLALLRYLEIKNKVPKSMLGLELKGLITHGSWSQKSAYFQISSIPVSSVRFVINKDIGNDVLSLASIKNYGVVEMNELITLSRKEPNSTETHQALYELYVINGDLDGANSSMDKIIELKFSK